MALAREYAIARHQLILGVFFVLVFAPAMTNGYSLNSTWQDRRST